MDNEVYKLYKKHRVELFDMIYDVCERAPAPDDLAFFFGTETKEQREEFDKKMEEYLKIEEPKIRERLKEMGFGSKKEGRHIKLVYEGDPKFESNGDYDVTITRKLTLSEIAELFGVDEVDILDGKIGIFTLDEYEGE